MIREEEFDDLKILDILQKDPIGRNQQLNTFIGLINSINKNSFLTIDGKWGSGKTVFVKQIEYLNRNNPHDVPVLSHDIVQKYQEEYVTYYYNAWKNDYHEDPLQSLLFNMINDFWGTQEKMADRTIKTSKGLINSVLKATSLGLYDPDEIRQAESISDLVKSITTVDERKRAIDDILDNYLDLKGKKLLFIVDELDRCRPTFAVKLLEALKHYYTNDRLVFLLSTNNHQLSHTITKVYGDSFDGSGYLNKFYDLVFNLPLVDSEKYLQYIGSSSNTSLWKDIVPHEVVKYLNLSMREVNRYYSSLNLIKDYLSSTSGFYERSQAAVLVKYIFIPLAYGLRIHNPAQYDRFINGEELDVIEGFCRASHVSHRLITNNGSQDSQDPIEVVKQIYNKLFAITTPSEPDDYSIVGSAETFRSVVLLINSTGTIDESPEEE